MPQHQLSGWCGKHAGHGILDAGSFDSCYLFTAVGPALLLLALVTLGIQGLRLHRLRALTRTWRPPGSHTHAQAVLAGIMTGLHLAGLLIFATQVCCDHACMRSAWGCCGGRAPCSPFALRLHAVAWDRPTFTHPCWVPAVCQGALPHRLLCIARHYLGRHSGEVVPSPFAHGAMRSGFCAPASAFNESGSQGNLNLPCSIACVAFIG